MVTMGKMTRPKLSCQKPETSANVIIKMGLIIKNTKATKELIGISMHNKYGSSKKQQHPRAIGS